MKLFADLERKRREAENKISTEAAKTREAQLQAEEKKNVEKEFAKNWEESRQGRVNSWLNFTGKAVHNSSNKNSNSSNSAVPNVSPSAPPSANVSLAASTVLNQGSNQSTGGYSGFGGIKNVWNPQSNTQSTHGSSYAATNNYSPYGGVNSYDQRYEQGGNITSPPEKKQKKKKEKRFSPMGFRPPKHKPETRD